MVRVAAFFIAGVLLAIYLPTLLPPWLSISLSAILISFYFLIRFLVAGKMTGLVTGVIGLFAIGLLGYTHLSLRANRQNTNQLFEVKNEIESYTAFVRSTPESKSKSWKIEVEVNAIKTTTWQKATGRVLLYVSKNRHDVAWRYGDQIMIYGSPQMLKLPANPGEFDFKRFLSFKNIYHQQYVLPHQVKWIAGTEQKGFIYYSHRVRAWALRKLNTYVEGEQEQAIAAALILGVTEGIDTDLLNAYASSGAMHVLAVSGLHVGIIYAILLLLLRPLDRFAWSRWAVAIISLIFLWVFAFVTGLSPSVLRAVVMFSFVAIARPFGTRTNIYNTLAASAFVLLLYNPYLIMSVGFQLSYLAVIGIVYLQKPIYNLWELENRMWDWVWQITCVSIAAQVATFSLGLLYFHQFPVYFLISNLFVIPLSTCILVLGILVLAVSIFSPLAILVGKTLTWIIYFLNWTVLTTERLPFSLIGNIYISTLQCWLLMGVLVSVILLFKFRTIWWMYSAALLTILFSWLQWQNFQESFIARQFVVYSIPSHKAYEFTQEGHSYFMADSSLLQDEERIRFHIRPNRIQHGVTQVHQMGQIPFRKFVNGLEIFVWQQKSFGLISHKNYKFPTNFKIDYLMVSENLFPTFRKLEESVQIGALILDGTNARSFSSKLRKFAKMENIPTYDVVEQGAFILND